MKMFVAWGFGILGLACAAESANTATFQWGRGAPQVPPARSWIGFAGESKEDLKKLEGTWKGKLDGKKIQIEFAKDKFTITFGGDKSLVFKGSFKIDAKKKPKEMDLVFEDAKFFQGKTGLAIYELDNDTLKWCSSEPGKEARPKVLPAQEGETAEGALYFILHRAK